MSLRSGTRRSAVVLFYNGCQLECLQDLASENGGACDLRGTLRAGGVD
jgi:hypothetical protein